MKIGVTQLVMPRDWTLEEALRAAKDAGYEGLEALMREDGPISPAASDGDLAGAKALAAEVGVEITSLCPSVPGLDLSAPDDETWGQSLELVRALLRCGRGVGASAVLVVPGRVTETNPYDAVYERVFDALRAVREDAQQAGVCIAVENVWNKFLLSPVETALLLDNVGSEWVGNYHDTGNMMIWGYPEQWIRILGPHVKKVHFKDFQRAGYEWKPLGEGDVDFAGVMRELRNLGYDDYVISEVSTDLASLEETAEAMRRVIAL
jgi:hexulose-6-phosphate isomerase